MLCAEVVALLTLLPHLRLLCYQLLLMSQISHVLCIRLAPYNFLPTANAHGRLLPRELLPLLLLHVLLHLRR